MNVLQQPDITTQWQQTLQVIASAGNTTPLLAGYSTRLLADYKLLEGDALIRAFHFAMSTATDPALAAAWLEGFLRGSGTLLLIDHDLWNLVNNWVASLNDEVFQQVLPLLRRTFAAFAPAERKKLGEKVKAGGTGTIAKPVAETSLDEERAKQGIPIIMTLFGLTKQA